MEATNIINPEVASLRAAIDVMRGAISVLAGAAMVAMDVRRDRDELLQFIDDIAREFEASAVGNCPGRAEREVGIKIMLEFLAADVRTRDGEMRPKPVSLDFLSQQHGELLQQMIGVVNRERERDQVIKGLVANFQAALGPARPEHS